MEKLTKEKLHDHIRLNLNGGYNAMVIAAALYKKIYGEFPKIGMSGQQGEFANELLNSLP
jgi:hypothetical protein